MSPGYESPYSSHRDLLSSTPQPTRQNGNSAPGNLQQEQASPASPHSYSPIPQSVYNGMTRQNGGSGQQNISINTSAPSPTLSAQSAELHSPSDQQMDKLWNGKMMDTNSHLNGSQSSFVQMNATSQQHHMGQHHHNQNSRELLSAGGGGGGSISPIPQGIMQRVSLKIFLREFLMTFGLF